MYYHTELGSTLPQYGTQLLGAHPLFLGMNPCSKGTAAQITIRLE